MPPGLVMPPGLGHEPPKIIETNPVFIQKVKSISEIQNKEESGPNAQSHPPTLRNNTNRSFIEQSLDEESEQE